MPVKKSLVILVDNYYEDLELWYPKLYFGDLGVKVDIAAKDRKKYTGKNGYPVEPNLRIADLEPHRYDAVIIPGGFAPDYLRRYPETLSFLRDMNNAGRLIGFICHAGWVLISAKIIRNRKVTGYYPIKDDLVNAGAIYQDEPVVIDKNLISSRMPSDLPKFCSAMQKAMGL